MSISSKSYAIYASPFSSNAAEPARVAVEYGRKIVKQAIWTETVLRDAGQVEIVQFVGGG